MLDVGAGAGESWAAVERVFDGGDCLPFGTSARAELNKVSPNLNVSCGSTWLSNRRLQIGRHALVGEGTGAFERATVEMWNRRMELALLLPVAQAFRQLHPSMVQLEVPQVPAWGEANRIRAQDMLRILDKELSQRQYMAGPAFTIADITALVAIDFMKPARIERPVGLASLERWYGEVAARPSAKA